MKDDVNAEPVSSVDDLPIGIDEELKQMTFLTDDELWRAARSQMTAVKNQRMQELMWKQQREGLAWHEQSEAEHLSRRADRVMLIRAQAAVLLKDRGHDISEMGTRWTTQ
jgi:hypothetical protein